MPDTKYSIYSEYDKACELILKEKNKFEKSLEQLLKKLKESENDSTEFNKTLKELLKLEEEPLPYVIYAYTDEEGNDNYTYLGVQGKHHIKELDSYRHLFKSI
ncbi:MAG: hypothetical protein WC307_03400 [Candidatus Nanoarchaeia archaeon]|jgi:hypothetical protein